MKAVLFYGVRLPVINLVSGPTENYEYVFTENFVGSDWQFHTREDTKARRSSYLCLARLVIDSKSTSPFLLITPNGLQESKLTSAERAELRDIMKTLGVPYEAPKWYLTASE